MPKPYSEAHIRDVKQIKALRAALGLPPVRKGYRTCLCCNRNFLSEDLANQKTCNHCRQEAREKNET